MLGILTAPRQPLTELATPPRSYSAWLLAGALFFTAIPDFDPGLPAPLFILLFLAAGAVGAIERAHLGEFWMRGTLRTIGFIYLVAAFCLTIPYLVTGLSDLVFGSPKVSGQIPITYYSYTEKSIDYFTGTLGAQEIPFLKLFAGVVLMPLVMLLVRIRSATEFRFVLLVGTAGSLYGALFTIAFCNGFIPWHSEPFWTYLRRAQGLNAHPNILGMNTFLALPGLCILLVECRNRIWQGIAVLGIAVILWAIDYSGSRVSLGGVLIALALMVVTLQSGLKKQIQTALFVAAISFASLMAARFLLRFLEFSSNSAIARFVEGRAVASDSIRSTINAAAFNDVWASPIMGSGYEVLLVAHNVFLQILHAGGIFGFSGFMLTLLLPVWLLHRLPESNAMRTSGQIMLSAVGAVIVMNFTQSNPYYFSISLFLAMAVYAGLSGPVNGQFSPLEPASKS